jgi:flagellar basal-body rod modification protein FlgD
MATSVDPLQQYRSTTPATPTALDQSSGLTPDRLASGVDFFKLLTAQMQAQDPMQPVDNTQFLTQLAQYTQLQQQLSTNNTLSSMAALQQSLSALQTMTQTASMIGRTVDYVDPTSGADMSGNVTGVSASNGQVVLDVDGSKVPLNAITAVRAEG